MKERASPFSVGVHQRNPMPAGEGGTNPLPAWATGCPFVRGCLERIWKGVENMKRTKRLISLLLCGVMLLTFVPTAAFAVPMEPNGAQQNSVMTSPARDDDPGTAPGGITGPSDDGEAPGPTSAGFADAVEISEVALYVGDPNDGGTAIGDEPYLIKEGDQLYLYYSFEITADQMDEISSGTKYAINVPEGLKIIGDGEEELTLDDGTTKFATLTWGPDGASIKFEAGFLDEYDSLSECTLYFGCAFDEVNFH